MSVTIPTTQRAWCWPGRGEPQSLRLEDIAVPAPSAGEVLIANHAIGLNPVDWKMIEWGHADWKPGHVPGVDGMGEIVAAGDGVTLPIGVRVAYHQSLSRHGSFAEYTCVSATSLLVVPDGVSDEIAAALPCPGLTAWQAASKVPTHPGRDVLITGAGGAVGLILAQLAVDRHWRVWVTASPVHHDGLLSLGVAGAFDYRDASWKEKLQAALGPRRLDVAFDTVSSDHAHSLAPMLGYNGHLVCIQDRLESPPLPAFTTAVSLHEVALNSAHHHAVEQDWRHWREAGEALLQQALIGNLRLPPIRTAAFAELPTALAALKAKTEAGKMVVSL